MKRYLYALVIVLALSAQPTPPAPRGDSLLRPPPTWHKEVDPEGLPSHFAFDSFADYVGNVGANSGSVGDLERGTTHPQVGTGPDTGWPIGGSVSALTAPMTLVRTVP